MLPPDSPWRNFDWLLFIPVLGLAGASLGLLYSAGDQSAGLVVGQAVRFGIALTVFFTVAAIPPAFLVRMAPYCYAATLAALCLVLILNEETMGAQRWLPLGPFTLQPSELMKPVLLVTLAAFLHRCPYPLNPSSLVSSLLLIALPAGLIAIEPDLGTALLITVSGLVTVFLAGASRRLFLGLGALAAVSLPGIWALLHDYQQRRLISFFDPNANPYAGGYQLIQSQIAIGSGGLTGKGWLNGTQAHLAFLPERHTDFVFAVLSEEFGLLGGITLIAVYLLLTYRGLVIARRSRELYNRLTAAGLATAFFLYAFTNIGMTAGLLPVVGVPLPLVSFGGSALVSLMAGLGLLMGISLRLGL